MPRATQVTARASRGFAYGSLTLCGRTFQNVPLASEVPFGAAPTTPTAQKHNAAGLGSAPVARRYWGYHVLFSLPPGTKMFQFPGFASTHNVWMTVLQTAGLPHSDIGGSRAACASPPLFAACHVFHRLPEPRHPPCALSFVRLNMASYFPQQEEHDANYIPAGSSERAGALCSTTISLADMTTCAMPFLSVPTFQITTARACVPRVENDGLALFHYAYPYISLIMGGE